MVNTPKNLGLFFARWPVDPELVAVNPLSYLIEL